MSSNTVKTIHNTNTKVSNTIEDMFKILLKLMDEKKSYLKDKAFLSAMKDKDMHPVFLSMENVAAKRLLRELDKAGIPYMQFDIRNSSKDLVLIRPDDRKRVQDLENSIRIHAGLEIDTKAELDRALSITDPHAKEYIITGLTEYETDRIIQMSQSARVPVTVVREEQSDGTFLIACHDKHEGRVSCYAITAILENETKSKEMEAIIEGNKYIGKQKKEFAMAVEEIRDINRTKEAYLFSLREPEKYIHIRETGFDIVDRGFVTHSMNISQNPELYPDALKLIGNSLDYPVFKLAGEVNALGGKENALLEARTHISGELVPKNYPTDTQFKQWVNESLSTKNGQLFDNREIIKSLDTEQFRGIYLLARPQERVILEQKIPYYKQQLEALYLRLETVTAHKEIPALSFEDILANHGVDMTIHEEFYSNKEVENINDGAYIHDSVNFQEDIAGKVNQVLHLEEVHPGTSHDIASDRATALAASGFQHTIHDEEKGEKPCR